MANRNTIEFECPRCLSAVTASGDDSGKRTPCPGCQLSLLVPQQTIKQDLFDDIFYPQSAPPKAGDKQSESRDVPRTKKVKPSASAATDHSDAGSKREPSPLAGEDDLLPKVAQPESTGPIPREPDDPFQVDEDAPLKIDGISDGSSFDDVFGLKCPVCDTLIHVDPSQVGSNVECPVCYSQVSVKLPESNKKTKPRWRYKNSGRSQIRPDDALNLSEPIDRPKVDYNIDDSFGLEPVTDDLLAPRRPQADSDENPDSTQSVEPRTTSARSPKPGQQRQPEKEKTRREKFEASQRRQQESDQKKSKFHLSTFQEDPQIGQSNDEIQGFPEFDLGSLNRAVFGMFASPGLKWRTIVAVLLTGVGWAIMHEFSNSFANQANSGQPTFGDWALNIFGWFLLGGLPFLAGTALLWFICGHVFRDAARGFRQVSGWSISGISELSSTFLIFSFSFFISGLPMAFIPLLITPFRFMFAPPLLLAAWFNRSPFAIVSIDAFETFKQDAYLWKSFYTYIFILVILATVAGLMLMISVFLLSWVFSLVGMAMIVPITIGFAAVTGWHCGRIVESLEKQA